ncbi:MAG: NAD(+) synthase [Clostridiales bacterium]|jgi:NAD+ synthase (glutamine-hydrolysing)|nr:NAD(+) synthase [Clostridiales bacterium]
MDNIKDLGFMRVATITPEVKIADPWANAQEIKTQYNKAIAENQPALVLTPELSLTGYTCGDLFGDDTLINESNAALKDLMSATYNKPPLVVGAPIRHKNKLFNCAVVLADGAIKCIIPKTHLPNYGEFYDKRYFASSKDNKDTEVNLFGEKIPFGTDIIFGDDFAKFGIEICEDAWVPNPPANALAENGANVILNLSASNEIIGKANYRKQLVNSASGRQIGAYVYCSAGATESSADLVFGGHSLISENGSLIAENKRFDLTSNITCADINIRLLNNFRRRNMSMTNISDMRNIDVKLPDKIPTKLMRKYSKTPFVPQNESKRKERCDEILEIQSTALAQRMKASGIKKIVVGLSGGLDSTLAFIVMQKALKKLNLPPENLVAVTMPGFGTTNRTKNNAVELATNAGATLLTIDIKDSVMQHFKDIGQDPNTHDVTYENAQARERTQVLFDLANKMGGMVIGTGDLSEIALGWDTYGGDHLSNYSVNASVPKTLVRFLVSTVADEENNDILRDICATPVSPELLPPNADGTIAQITEDTVGPYELHDYFLYHRVRLGEDIATTFNLACDSFEGNYDKQTIFKWLSKFEYRFATQQFKRNCMPDGPKIGTVSLSPRGDLRMPTDASLGTIKKVLERIEQTINQPIKEATKPSVKGIFYS